MKPKLILYFLIFFFLISTAQEKENLIIGQKEKIRSEILGESRTIKICLPEDYAQNNISYPVFYVLDANMTSTFTEAVSAAAHLIMRRICPGIIIVGIETLNNRNRDTIPVSIPNRPGSGGAENFLKFLNTELKPYIDQSYRTDKENNIIYGASNAGLFVVYTFLSEPSSFKSYIAASPMIGHCSTFMYDLLDNLTKDSQSYIQKSIYFNYGKYDLDKAKSYIPDFYKTLTEKASDELISKLQYFEDQGHVPYGSIFQGLLLGLSER